MKTIIQIQVYFNDSTKIILESGTGSAFEYITRRTVDRPEQRSRHTLDEYPEVLYTHLTNTRRYSTTHTWRISGGKYSSSVTYVEVTKNKNITTDNDKKLVVREVFTATSEMCFLIDHILPRWMIEFKRNPRTNKTTGPSQESDLVEAFQELFADNGALGTKG